MTAPNLQTAGTATPNNALVSLTSTNATQLVSNASSSGKTFQLYGIIVANTDTSNAVSVTVSRYAAATNSGTAYPICSTTSVPANSTLLVLDQPIMLLEAQSIYVTAGTASKLVVSADWQEFSA